jgi:hypothetical protein
VACRTSRAKRDLQRIVRSPDGRVTLDPTGRLTGRGAYVCHDTDCLTIAINKGALSRALETGLPPSFLESVPAGPTHTDNNPGGNSGQE